MLVNTDSSIYCQQYLDQIQSLAKPNKYTQWYLRLCRRAALRASTKKAAQEIVGYVESHHVVPKSFNTG
jgi:hypothetical protein